MSDVKSVNIRGLLDTYEFRCVLPGSGKEIKLRPITTGQMKKVLAYEQETDTYAIEEALDELIKGCVINEDFNIDDLYLQDRFFLMLELRKVSKGSIYGYTYKCPDCGAERVGTVDLNDLQVKTKPDAQGVIKINDSLSFNVDFPRRKDQKEAVKFVKKKGKLSESQRAMEIMTTTLAASIVSAIVPSGVVDDVPLEDRVFILDNIKSDVFSDFNKWFDDNWFGVEFKTTVQCMACPREQVIDIPLNDFFG